MWYDGVGIASILSTVALSGDYNDDGVVDAADYTVWRDNLGSAVFLPNDAIGGTVGIEHYNQWKSNFGRTTDSSAESAAAVPEPRSLALLGILGVSKLLGARFTPVREVKDVFALCPHRLWADFE